MSINQTFIMRGLKRYLLLFGISFCFQSAIYAQDIHQIKSVVGSTGNQLEVLDWGGKGRTILFLTGLGNTAHVYDSFAPRFTNSFHVYGMSRRGYGASEQTDEGYGIDTLTKDILSVIDALGVGKVILIGHSIAGDEITSFAAQYPNRVSSVVYLDAAYDHSHLEALPFPDFFEETTKDSLSVQDLNEDLKKLRGFVFPEDELRHQYVFSAQGFRTTDVTPQRVQEAILKGVRLPDYKGVKCPALAIYGQRNTAEQWFASFPYMDSAKQKKAVNNFMPAWKTYYTTEINRFRTEKPDGVVKEILGADHYTFLTHPDETERLIRAFLK
jgi:non-heme chloroperoxidase